MRFEIEPVGYVSCSRTRPVDDVWDAETSSIQLTERFRSDALLGLGDHGVDPIGVETGARHPRGNPEWPLVGIFAQRAKNRPNRLGTTVCRLLRIDGTTIHLSGLDAIDGTPVLDIKPVMTEFLPRGSITQPAWSRELKTK